MPGDPHAPPLDDPFSLVGTLLDRKYRVTRVVAHGGYGVVYAGKHLSLDVPVAIKILRPARAVDPDRWGDLLAQFLDEAKTLAKLRHPNVVAVLDSGVAQLDDFGAGVPWMVLEWLEGETLRDALAAHRAGGDRSPRECMELMRPVLEAIADAHDAGIVHRDLKPSNIMLVPTKRGPSARVLDFGIAKIVHPDAANEAPSGETATESRVSAFTFASAAPEQLSGARTGPWTDVFALGLMMTELLADRPALPVDDPTEHYRAVFAAERPTPRALGVDAGAWEGVLARALAVRPGDRQPNARALLAELEATLPDAKREPSAARAAAATEPLESLDGGYSATDRRATEDVARRASERSAASSAPGARAPFPRWARVGAGLATLGALASGAAALRFVARDRSAVPRGGRTDASEARACTNASCTSTLGRPAVCRHETGACVALESEDCVVRAEPRDLQRDDTVFIGSMFPRTGQNAADYGMWNHHAVELARRDFAQIMGAVSGAHARPLAVLECDDEVDPDRAAAHLANDVGVPAVIGFKGGTEAIRLANSLFVPRRVLMMVATNGNPMITMIPHPPGVPRLVFRTTYSTVNAAAAIGRLVGDVLEPQLRAAPGFGASRLRVASLRGTAARGSDIGHALLDELRFNGKSALENGDDYRDVSYPFDAPEGSPELAAAAAALLSFEPSVIVYEGGHAAARGIVAPVEERWPGGAPRPRWVSASELAEDEFAIIGRDAARRRRFFGVTPVSETAANADFVTHYREIFPEPVSRTESPNSSYDAFYLLAFASYAIPPGDAVTGVGLSGAMARLVPPGKEIEVGMSGIFEAYTALANGGRVDVTGATGKLDFDLATGESAFDQSILCVGVDASGRAASGVPSGLVYVAATQRLTGEMRCP